jgi:NitT/TauT family transport system substrate-binding protein
MKRRWMRGVVALLAVTLVAAGCGSADDEEDSSGGGGSGDGGGETSGEGFELACSDTPPEVGDELTEVSLQLQWVTQAQFGGYFAAVDQGFYEEHGLDVEIVEGGVDIVPQTQLADGAVDFAIAWVPKALQSIEGGAGITNISQPFQRSGTLQVSWADAGIESVEDLEGKNVGNWGFGNEFELFAGLTQAGLDPASDITLVQQQFDMQALLNREIDAAQAMTYNEYAQVLEAVNPDTGELYTEDDFSVINWNDEGTAMLQDAIWANTEQLTSDQEYCDTAVRFVAASLQGWAYCRDNPDSCVESVLSAGSELGESHQAWQMNEINKLIWPSPEAGAGTIEADAWDQTVEISLETKNADGSTVITEEPPASASTGEINEAAVALLEEADVDVVGADFEPTEVELQEGGA